MPVTTAHRTPDKESITELVHVFYADVRKHDLLGPVFDKALHGQWDAHLQRLVDFWSTVLLGTRSFKGNVLNKHLLLQDVTPAHFAAWVHLWNGHTARLFAPEVAHSLQAAAHGVARNLFRGYFGSLPAFAASEPQEPHAQG